MRLLTFTDGFTSGTAPSVGAIAASSLQQFANDAAFVAGKGSAASAGDAYYNTTSNVIRYYDAGAAAWKTIIPEHKPAFTAAATFTSTGDFGAEVILPEISTPATPSSGKGKIYFKTDGFLYQLSDGGTERRIAAGGGGGGSAQWQPGAVSPVEVSEFGEKVWRFSSGDAGVQQLNLYLKTPSSYVAGTQITLKIGLYSPSSSNTILLQTTTRLYEDNEDLSASPTGHASGNSALTNTVSNGFRSTTLNLTDSSGQIDGQAVNADELLKVELVRGTDSDTADIRFIPGSTEAIFA